MNTHTVFLSYPGLSDREDVFIASPSEESLEKIYRECQFEGTPDPDKYESEWELLGTLSSSTGNRLRLLRSTTDSNVFVTIEGGDEDIALPQPMTGCRTPYIDQYDLIEGWNRGGWHLPRVLWGEEEFVLAAMAENGGACLDCWGILWDDPEFCRRAVEVQGTALAQVPHRYCTRDLCLLALADDPGAAEFVPANYWRSVKFCARAILAGADDSWLPPWIGLLVQAAQWALPTPTTGSAITADLRQAARKLLARYGRRSRI